MMSRLFGLIGHIILAISFGIIASVHFNNTGQNFISVAIGVLCGINVFLFLFNGQKYLHERYK